MRLAFFAVKIVATLFFPPRSVNDNSEPVLDEDGNFKIQLQFRHTITTPSAQCRPIHVIKFSHFVAPLTATISSSSSYSLHDIVSHFFELDFQVD